MSTLGARLALWYSIVSTLTLFTLLAAGYYLLNLHLVRGVDLQNAAEFERTFAKSENYQALQGRESNGFLVDVQTSEGRTIYRSPDLKDAPLPAGKDTFTAKVGTLGDLRFGTFSRDGFTVKIASSLAPVQQVMLGYAEISLVLICLVLLISLISGMVLSRVALRPVRLIQETANRIRSDNLGERIPVSEIHDEISSLARLLNEMFDRLEASFQQVRRFSADASHELKTPLSLMRLQAEKLLTDGGLDPALEEVLHEQLEEITRMNHIIEDLLFLSRAEAQAITPKLLRQNPHDFLQSFAQDAALLAEQANITFLADIEAEGEVFFDAKWMRQVLLNLTSNAIRASPSGGMLTLKSEFTLHDWLLELEDDGPGVPPDQYERIFERFVRLDAGEGGTGLGLAICRSILRMHGGDIRAEKGPRKGGLRIICQVPLPRASTLAPDVKKAEHRDQVD